MPLAQSGHLTQLLTLSHREDCCPPYGFLWFKKCTIMLFLRGQYMHLVKVIFFSKYKSLLSTRLFLVGRIVAELVEHRTQLLISGS